MIVWTLFQCFFNGNAAYCERSSLAIASPTLGIIQPYQLFDSKAGCRELMKELGVHEWTPNSTLWYECRGKRMETWKQ